MGIRAILEWFDLNRVGVVVVQDQEVLVAATGGDGEPTGEVGVNFALEVGRVEDDGVHVACLLGAIGVGGEGGGRGYGCGDRCRVYRVWESRRAVLGGT